MVLGLSFTPELIFLCTAKDGVQVSWFFCGCVFGNFQPQSPESFAGQVDNSTWAASTALMDMVYGRVTLALGIMGARLGNPLITAITPARFWARARPVNVRKRVNIDVQVLQGPIKGIRMLFSSCCSPFLLSQDSKSAKCYRRCDTLHLSTPDQYILTYQCHPLTVQLHSVSRLELLPSPSPSIIWKVLK
jgi:hypothetical protein